jgi:glycosyltransferase involved in cell wall biosynthesis
LPTSWYQAIPPIMDLVVAEKPQSILDIGIGFGKFGMLIRDTLEIPFERYEKQQWEIRLDGIEIFEPYKNPVHQYMYDNVYYSDILDVIDKLPKYDVILLVDVIEHLSKDEGQTLIGQLLSHTNKALIVSTPLYPEVQVDYLGNKHEQHKSRWTILDLSGFNHSRQLVKLGNNAAQIYVIRPRKNFTGNTETSVVDTTHGPCVDAKRPMTIGYVLPHKHLTGGVKMLLEQMRFMRKMGNYVYAFGAGGSEEPVLPDWYKVTVDKEVLVPKEMTYSDHVKECDVIIAGWIGQLPQLVNSKVPVVYWEQGHEWLFGEGITREIEEYLESCYHQPCYLASVSPIVSKIIETRYGRKATVLSNGIDTDFYYPGKKNNDSTILLVGNPFLDFKGFDVAIRALCMVKAAGYDFKVTWVCQTKPSIDELPFPIEYIVGAPQAQLAEAYRISDVFMFTSWYEGFGMPPLEAMASGVPVVTTACGGIQSYVRPGFNALVAEPGDANALASSLIYLLKHEDARRVLGANGRQTALRFDLSRMVAVVDAYLRSVIDSWRSASRNVRD